MEDSLKAKELLLQDKKINKNWVRITAQISDHSAKLAGVPFKVFYTDAPRFVYAQVFVQSYYGFDSVSFTNDVYNFEAEALGAKMVFSDQVMPAIDVRKPLIQEPFDVGKIRTPNFFNDARFPYQLEVFRLKKEMGFNQATFCGPFSLAVALRSYPRLIRDMKKDPGFFKELMQRIIDQVTMPYIETVHQQLGITEFRGSDAWATFPLLSPPMLEEYILPWNLYVIEKGQDLGVNSYVFSPGFYGDNQQEEFDTSIMSRCYDFSLASMGDLSPLLRIGRHPDYPLDPFVTYALDVKKRYPEIRIVLRVDSKILRDGPEEKIIYTIKRMLDAFCPEFEVSVLLGNVSVDTPPEHVHAAVQSTHYYGQLPYSFIDDGASFSPKKRESYGDYIDAVRRTKNA